MSEKMIESARTIVMCVCVCVGRVSDILIYGYGEGSPVFTLFLKIFPNFDSRIRLIDPEEFQ